MKQCTHPIPIVILAGGKGIRMGGIDKCLLKVGGKSILSRILDTFAEHDGPLLLNANGDSARFSPYAIPVVKDQASEAVNDDSMGPLAGLLTSLAYLQSEYPQAQCLLTLAGDCPFLPKNLIATLTRDMRKETEVVFCHSGGRDHFVIALWSMEIYPKLENYLRSGQRSVGRFIGSLHHEKRHFDTKPRDPFMNVNTQAQLLQAQKIARD